MLKIIIGSESFYPNVSGVAVSTEILAEMLGQAGHQVWVFAPSQNERNHYDQHSKNYQIFRLRSVRNPFRKGFRVAFRPYRAVAGEFDKIQPDIIHLQDPNATCSALLKIARQRGVPVVITNHFSLDYILSYLPYLKPLHGPIRWFLRFHLSRYYNRCRRVICPTKTVKKQLDSWGVKVPILAISNGIDIDRFYSHSAPEEIYLHYHLPHNPLVLYAGRIDKDKSLDVLIKAIPAVVKKVSAHFVICGMGDELPRIKKLVEKLGVSHALSYVGQLNRESGELEKIYQIATLFAIPSAIETQSLVTMEAMAAGKPIVAAAAGALPELVKDGSNGYLFPVGNSLKLASAIVKILTDSQLRQKMAEKSLEIISQHQIGDSFKKIVDLYEKVVAADN